jgi:hypothetical protein
MPLYACHTNEMLNISTPYKCASSRSCMLTDSDGGRRARAAHALKRTTGKTPHTKIKTSSIQYDRNESGYLEQASVWRAGGVA